MKYCPYCEFENFTKTDFCEHCGQSLYNIQSEEFHFAEFIKRNYQIYAIIGIFIALFKYLFESSDTNVKNASLVPLLLSIYLIGYLMVKSGRYSYLRDAGEFERKIELFVFLFLHLFFILGLIASVGTQYFLSISLLSGFFLSLLALVWGGKIQDRYWKIILIIVIFFEIPLLLLLILPTFLQFFDNPTLFFYYAMIMYALFFFSLGGFLANFVVSIVSSLSHHNLNYPEIFYCEVTPENAKYQLLAGFEILFGIIMTPIIYPIIFH
jgi:hypothetical protein